ncbi:unnamed protein product [Diplocarpon coronariae]|nr:hypothetical protein JHW43_004235 [Diplocarpon mali]
MADTGACRSHEPSPSPQHAAASSPRHVAAHAYRMRREQSLRLGTFALQSRNPREGTDGSTPEVLHASRSRAITISEHFHHASTPYCLQRSGPQTTGLSLFPECMSQHRDFSGTGESLPSPPLQLPGWNPEQLCLDLLRGRSVVRENRMLPGDSPLRQRLRAKRNAGKVKRD